MQFLQHFESQQVFLDFTTQIKQQYIDLEDIVQNLDKVIDFFEKQDSFQFGGNQQLMDLISPYLFICDNIKISLRCAYLWLLLQEMNGSKEIELQYLIQFSYLYAKKVSSLDKQDNSYIQKLKFKLKSLVILISSPNKGKKCSHEYFLLNLLFTRKISQNLKINLNVQSQNPQIIENLMSKDVENSFSGFQRFTLAVLHVYGSLSHKSLQTLWEQGFFLDLTQISSVAFKFNGIEQKEGSSFHQRYLRNKIEINDFRYGRMEKWVYDDDFIKRQLVTQILQMKTSQIEKLSQEMAKQQVKIKDIYTEKTDIDQIVANILQQDDSNRTKLLAQQAQQIQNMPSMNILDFDMLKEIQDEEQLKQAIKTFKILLPSFCHQFFSLCKYSIYYNKRFDFENLPLNLRLAEINKINNLEIDSYFTWVFKQDVQTLMQDSMLELIQYIGNKNNLLQTQLILDQLKFLTDILKQDQITSVLYEQILFSLQQVTVPLKLIITVNQQIAKLLEQNENDHKIHCACLPFITDISKINVKNIMQHNENIVFGILGKQNLQINDYCKKIKTIIPFIEYKTQVQLTDSSAIKLQNLFNLSSFEQIVLTCSETIQSVLKELDINEIKHLYLNIKRLYALFIWVMQFIHIKTINILIVGEEYIHQWNIVMDCTYQLIANSVSIMCNQMMQKINSKGEKYLLQLEEFTQINEYVVFVLEILILQQLELKKYQNSCNVKDIPYLDLQNQLQTISVFLNQCQIQSENLQKKLQDNQNQINKLLNLYFSNEQNGTCIRQESDEQILQILKTYENEQQISVEQFDILVSNSQTTIKLILSNKLIKCFIDILDVQYTNFAQHQTELKEFVDKIRKYIKTKIILQFDQQLVLQLLYRIIEIQSEHVDLITTYIQLVQQPNDNSDQNNSKQQLDKLVELTLIILYQFAIDEQAANKLFKLIYTNIILLTSDHIELLNKAMCKYNSENLKYLQKIQSTNVCIQHYELPSYDYDRLKSYFEQNNVQEDVQKLYLMLDITTKFFKLQFNLLSNNPAQIQDMIKLIILIFQKINYTDQIQVQFVYQILQFVKYGINKHLLTSRTLYILILLKALCDATNFNFTYVRSPIYTYVIKDLFKYLRINDKLKFLGICGYNKQIIDWIKQQWVE